jgi:toxin ParE1/3/4
VKRELEISARAKRDLARIIAYIRRQNPDAARQLGHSLQRHMLLLLDFPFLGRDRANLTPGARSLAAGNHLIIYRAGPERVTTLRVIDGRMDVEAEFKR